MHRRALMSTSWSTGCTTRWPRGCARGWGWASSARATSWTLADEQEIAAMSPPKLPPEDADEVFVGVCFAVKFDKTDIGKFSSCEGFGLEVVMEQREEGGNNGLIWQLPTRMKYSNIKLTRPVGPDSAKLTKWIVKALNGLKPTTGEIKAMDAAGNPVMTWQL